MLKDIIEVHPQPDYRLYLKFEDGIIGTVALNQKFVAKIDFPVSICGL